MKKHRASIRRATDADMKMIYSWLLQEEENEVEDNFLCYWKDTEQQHREKNLFVYLDETTNTPVAYQWGGLMTQWSVMQVRQDMRKKGIGKKLVAHCIAQAEKRNECLLLIECNPPSSIPFWQTMGFTLLPPENEQNYAYKLLTKQHRLPKNGAATKVAIAFYPEKKLHEKNIKIDALSQTVPSAIKTSDNVIHLAQRIFFSKAILKDYCYAVGDVVVEIKVDDDLWYFDKAKYPAAQQCGVYPCTHGFYIDRLQKIPIAIG